MKKQKTEQKTNVQMNCNGEWREHDGSKNPVDDYCVVEVRLRNGIVPDPMISKKWEWAHSALSDDIVEYRIHKEYML